MSNYIRLAVVLWVGLVAVSCNSTSTQDAQMTQAAALYEEALNVEEKTGPLVDELIQRRNSLSVQGRALSQEEQRFIEQVYALEERFSRWRENSIPIPTAAHSTKERSASEWLRLQEDHHKEIMAIQSEANKLITDI